MSSDVSRIRVKFSMEAIGDASGELIRFLSPRTVEALVRAMPLHGRAAVWKEEVYFETSVKMGAEKANSPVEKGAIAYWPMGNALCVFFGTTQPYSAVNIVGRVVENLDLFSQIKPGSRLSVSTV
ncbi:MAG: cyclophilin-like fold protein [archaeon]